MNAESSSSFFTPLRRIALIIMTLLVALVMGQALISSWDEPQVASRLELYQTDLLLRATEWQGADLPPEQAQLLRRNLLGDQPFQEAQKAYQSVRETAIATLDEGNQSVLSNDGAMPSSRLQNALEQQSELLDLIDLRLGILHAKQGDLAAAETAWQQVQGRNAVGSPLWRTAEVLPLLWKNEPLPDDTPTLLKANLSGWFRYQALRQFYQQTNATDALSQLQDTAQRQAERTLVILSIVGALPALGSLTGIGVLGFVGIQRLVRGKESLLARNSNVGWEVPWNGEIIWQVLIAGFFFLGQILMPLLLSPVGNLLQGLGSRGQALYALLYYVLMSFGAIAVLFFSIRGYRPLPAGWFRAQLKGSGLLWGLGGYLAALPLMLSVSLLNQQLWQGQGGSNPLLQRVLEEQDPLALGVFFFTAAIAAPVFEEVLFRGFLLPSLTRYVPVWVAVISSSLVFAIAHLSLSEVLPLFVLGSILGLVYTRSRNLLAPMLLHSAWNGVTMIGLFLLGSA